MPYDLLHMKSYKVNYNRLTKYFYSLPKFMSSSILKSYYLESWIYKLETCDREIVDIMTNPEKFKHYISVNAFDSEIYQIETILDKNTVLIHFRISSLLAWIEGNKAFISVDNWDVKKFSHNTDIKWTNELSLGNTSSEYPIIIVPYPVGIYKMLVIDGNHRLSYLISTGCKTVPVIYLTAKSFIDANMFLCTFDKLFYAMIVEIQSAIKGVQMGMKDNNIIHASFLRDGFFKYNE